MGSAMELATVIRSAPNDPYKNHEYRFEKVRFHKASCYPELLVLEVQAYIIKFEQSGLLSFLYGPDFILYCTGNSVVLHDINSNDHLSLNTPEEAADYAQLFCNLVRGSESRFQLLEPAIAAACLRDGKERMAETCPDPVEPRKDGEDWYFEAAVRHMDTLSHASFRIKPNGMVSMIDDQLLCRTTRTESWKSGFRFPAGDKLENDS